MWGRRLKREHSLMWQVGISIMASDSSLRIMWWVSGSTGGQPAKKMAYLNMGVMPFFLNLRCSCSRRVAATVAPSEYPIMASKGPRSCMILTRYLSALSVLRCVVAMPSRISSRMVSSGVSQSGNSRIRARTSSSSVFSTSLSGSMKRKYGGLPKYSSNPSGGTALQGPWIKWKVAVSSSVSSLTIGASPRRSVT